MVAYDQTGGIQVSAPFGRIDTALAVIDGAKKQLAELDSKYAAKIAEREIGLKGEIDDALHAGDNLRGAVGPRRLPRLGGRAGRRLLGGRLLHRDRQLRLPRLRPDARQGPGP